MYKKVRDIRKLKFEDYKYYLETLQLGNEINQLGKCINIVKHYKK